MTTQACQGRLLLSRCLPIRVSAQQEIWVGVEFSEPCAAREERRDGKEAR